MKEARFVSQNKEKWGKMENVSHLDTDTLASNYVILSDDLSYAKTFYPGSDVVKYLNQLISVYQINIYGQERSEKKGILSFWVREFPLLLYRERRTLLFAFLFLLFSALIGVFSTAKDDTFVRLFPGTYKRSYSFRNGALRGIKIVTGLIPFFIIAGWIESFITRYADTYPVVGAAAIILSLGGVIGYFVVYPYYLHKTETNGKD